jgi:predicted nucleic acid-binding protein
VRALEISPWIETVSPPLVPEQILGWGLGPRESSVLAVAYANPGMEAIIDDLAGRRCASLLGIAVRGTLGIVLAARKRGLIPQVRPVIETLIRSGMYLSRTVIEEALRRVGE